MSEASECLWFYEKDGEEAGPLPETEAVRLLKEGTIFPDTLLWTENMVQWQPALELEPFRSILREGESVWMPAPRPWVRFWARRVDFAIYEAVALGILMRAGDTFSQLETFMGVFLILGMILVEAALLNLSGTTFGKWLFNISLTTPGGEKISFDAGLYRTFLLWLRGLALGFPFVNLLAMAIGLRNLTVNEESSWDRDAATVVRHRKVSALRWVAAFLILATYSIALTVMLWPQVEKQINEAEKRQIEMEQKT